MKAVNKSAGRFEREKAHREAVEEQFGGELDDLDPGVVMVLLPKETWDIVLEMAERTDSHSADVLSGCIQLAYEKLEAKDGS